ncbi:MAG: ammonium transporter [Sphingopyxis sp.]
MIRPIAFLSFCCATLFAASPAIAATANAGPMIVPESGDTGWLLAALCIGLLAAISGTIAYAIGGHGRATATRILTAVTAAMALASLLYVLIGYSLVFDAGGSAWIGGGGNSMLAAMGTVRETTTVPETGFALFQLGFVLIAVALLNAMLAPRARPAWLLGFSGLWVILVIAPIMRWIWGGGWLAEMGAMDGAGGLVIFLSTAVSAFVALIIIGRKADAQAQTPDHAIRLVGALLLMIGMMAMAGGSTLGASDNSAVAMLTILTAAMTGALTSTALGRRLDAAALATGIVAGTVASAVAGDGVAIGAAWLTGVIAASIAHFAPRLMPQRLSWQDSDGSSSMATAAIAGGLLFAIFLAFDTFGGSGYGDGMAMGSQLIAQCAAVAAIGLWSTFGTLVCALMAGLVLPMRSDD